MIRKKIMALTLSAIMLLSTITPISALEKLDRIKGKNNYETAVKIAKEYAGLTTVGEQDSIVGTANIVLVNGNALVDGLAAAP